MNKIVSGITLWLTLTSCWMQPTHSGLAHATPSDRNHTPDGSIDKLDTEENHTTTHRYRRRYSGPIRDEQLSEISGMTVSQRDSNMLWVINDSGHPASLYAVDTQGNLLAAFKTQVENRDWESLTSLTLDNKPYLLIGDSGDNLGLHQNYRLHLFAEPKLDDAAAQPLEPVATTTFTYADGKHNSEAIGWSSADSKVIVITKKGQGAAVYSTAIAVAGHQKSEFIAQHEGSLAQPPQSVSDALISNLAGVEMSQVTGLEIDGQGRNAYVLTYRGIYLYRRERVATQTNGKAAAWEDWGKTFSRIPRLLSRHTLSQAEALALAPTTGMVYYTSEKLPAPLWRLEPFKSSRK